MIQNEDTKDTTDMEYGAYFEKMKNQASPRTPKNFIHQFELQDLHPSSERNGDATDAADLVNINRKNRVDIFDFDLGLRSSQTCLKYEQ